MGEGWSDAARRRQPRLRRFFIRTRRDEGAGSTRPSLSEHLVLATNDGWLGSASPGPPPLRPI